MTDLPTDLPTDRSTDLPTDSETRAHEMPKSATSPRTRLASAVSMRGYAEQEFSTRRVHCGLARFALSIQFGNRRLQISDTFPSPSESSEKLKNRRPISGPKAGF